MKFDAEVKREIQKIAIGCSVCTAIAMVVFLIIGQFDYTVAIGGAVGYIASFGNFFLMCCGVVKALETGDEAAAKLKLRSSYIMRTILQIGIIAIAIAVDFINWIPVAIAVFYPRVTITACNLWKLFIRGKQPPTEDGDADAEGEAADVSAEDVSATPASDADFDEDEPDEFEKFVSGFYKGDANTKK